MDNDSNTGGETMTIELTYTYRIGLDTLGDDLTDEEREIVAEEMREQMIDAMAEDGIGADTDIQIVGNGHGPWVGGARPHDADEIDAISEWAFEQAIGCVC